MAIFTVQPQAGTIQLELGYFTEVIRSDNGTEQRAMYREIPTRRLRFLARTLDLRNTGWLEALTYGGHGQEHTVPYWSHATTLTTQAVAGASVALQCSTTDRDFQIGGFLVLWNTDLEAEECEITAVSATSVTVATLAITWAVGTQVIPAYHGFYAGSVESAKLSPIATEMSVEFRIETAADDLNVTEATSTPLFTVVPVQHVDVSHTYEQMVHRQNSPFYQLTDYRRRRYPIGGRPYELWLENRAGVADIVEFFHSVRGRLRSFWMPTYQHDLEVVNGLGSSTLVITECGYAARMLSAFERRHLAFFTPDGAYEHLEVASAVDNGNGTESLFLVGASPATALMVSYLLYGRLGSDAIVITWVNNEGADCQLEFIELPQELQPPPVSPGLAAFIVEGLAPTVTTSVQGTIVTPGAGQAFFAGFTPTVSTSTPQPGVGEATFEGFVPVIFVGLNIAPPPGLVAFEGFAPQIARVPGTGSVTFKGFRPRVKTN